MNAIKRVLSMILVLVMALSMMPLNTQAEETPQTSFDSSDITIEGTNGFGNLLSNEIVQYQSDTENAGDYPGGYTVTDLEISGNQATVTYDSMEEAQLVVALYTEDGVQLLTSATATVSSEETQAVLTIPGTMPQYFMASAYLLDSYDYSPLCPAYDTPMYTKEMQELMASTVDDYDADRVLNLDEDKTTNFAVYADETVIIEPVSGVNTVSSMDDESYTYIITNADEQITSLQPGTVFVYPYAENELLIVKVAAIQADGTTVTITGEDLEMEEVFSHVKIESVTDSDDVTVTDLNPDDGVEYVGSSSDSVRQISALAWDDDVELDISHRFGLDETFKSNDADTEVNIQGGLEFVLDGKIDFYISWQRQFVKLQLDLALGVSIHVDGEISTEFNNFAEFKIGPIKGVTIICKPAVEVGFSGEIQFEIMVTTTFAIAYESGKGFTNLSTSPKVETELELEGSFFIGVDLKPTANIISKYVAEAELSAPVGLNVKAELTKTDFDNILLGTTNMGPSIHSCKDCLEIAASIQAELKVKLKFLNWDKLTKETSFVIKPVTWPFYWSLTNDDSGAGQCPYEEYRVTVEVTDANGKGVANAVVNTISNASNEQTEMTATNNKGITLGYYPAGTYTFETSISGSSLKKTVTIDDACKILLNEDTSGASANQVGIAADSVVDGQPGATGWCGQETKWELFSNGLLVISGTGHMYDFADCSKVPWYGKGSVTKVVIKEGILSVGNYAFYQHESLSDVTLPDSLTSIGDYAFSDAKITSITIPESVKSIGNSAFSGCSSLTGITLPEGVTSIGDDAFWSCSSLISVTIPDSVTAIGDGAFSGCSSLTTVTIPDGVTSIGDFAFIVCYNLTSVTIPDSVTSIGTQAFHMCTSLTNVTIPDSVTSIGNYAFSGCNLDSVTIPAGVSIIGENAFSGCPSLTTVTISDGLTSISNYAFYNCESLTNVTIPDSVTAIGDDAFSWCNNMTDIYYSGTQTQWGRINIGSGNEVLTSATIHFNSTGPGAASVLLNPTTEDTIQSSEDSAEEPARDAIFGGDYDTVINDGRTLKRASFTGLVPGGQYLLLALVDVDAEELLAPENLLYIDQAPAGEDGTLTFCYAQRVNKEVSYVIACGPSNRNLADATITFPTMTVGGQLQVVNPTVTYDGKTLTEGVDYVILGTVDYTNPGTYTCYVRGIYNYTGLVACKYTVNEEPAPDKPYKIVNVVSGVHVYWKSVPGAVKYGVWRSETGKDGTYKWLGNPTVPHFTDIKVQSGKTYYYRVTVMNTSGVHSAKSDAIGITYVSTPDISARYNKAAGVKLDWKKVTGATGYAIYRKSYSGNDAWVRVATISGNSTLTWTDTSVKNNNGTAYKYTIRALAGANMKTLSGCRNAGRSMVRLTSRTLTGVAKASATSIKCSWNTSTGVTGYEIRFMVGDQVYKTFTVGNYATGVKTFTGLQAGQTYKIQVRSYKKIDGMGFYSAWSTAREVKL